MRKKPNLLILAGIACLVAVAGVFVVTGGGGDDGGGGDAPDTVAVVVATGPLSPGTLGDQAVADGMVEVQQVPVEQAATDAVSDAAQLSGTILTLPVEAGAQLRTAGLRTQSLLSSQFEVPEGQQAIAVSVDHTAGVAGYLTPGDRVNVFLFATSAAVQPGAATDPEAAAPADSYPRSELLLTNVTVLGLGGGAPTSPQATATATAAVEAGGSPSTTEPGSAVTVLLAVDTEDAEKIIYGNRAPGSLLYLTRVRADAEPSGPTGGRDAASILAEEANDAFTPTAENP